MRERQARGGVYAQCAEVRTHAQWMREKIKRRSLGKVCESGGKGSGSRCAAGAKRMPREAGRQVGEN